MNDSRVSQQMYTDRYDDGSLGFSTELSTRANNPDADPGTTRVEVIVVTREAYDAMVSALKQAWAALARAHTHNRGCPNVAPHDAYLTIEAELACANVLSKVNEPGGPTTEIKRTPTPAPETPKRADELHARLVEIKRADEEFATDVITGTLSARYTAGSVPTTITLKIPMETREATEGLTASEEPTPEQLDYLPNLKRLRDVLGDSAWREWLDAPNLALDHYTPREVIDNVGFARVEEVAGQILDGDPT